MRTSHLLLPIALLATVAGCESILEVKPTTVVPEELAVVDAVSARAALAGAYDALQSVSYYGSELLTLPEVLSDNAGHTGTYTEFGDADLNNLTSDNLSVQGTWDAAYVAIDRANVILEKVPGVTGLSSADRDQMLGEAYFLRALSHFHLARFWGGVPIRTARVTSIEEASTATRATLAEVYTQILADLQQAEQLMTVQSARRSGSDVGVQALRARVLLYRESAAPLGLGTGNWAAVEAAANTVLGTAGLSLAPAYSDLFTRTGTDTPEDLFRVRFSDQDQGSVSYYYAVRSIGGRRELGPTSSIRTAYEPGDARGVWSVKTDPINPSRFYVAKFPSVTGTEHIHTIRLAEIYLIRAEARARQGTNLAGAVDDYNMLRVRAGLAPHVLGVNVITQQDVLDAIDRERRVELAFEGDRWSDLVRTGRAVAVLGLVGSEYQILFPIPQQEIDVTQGGLVQNPGY